MTKLTYGIIHESQSAVCEDPQGSLRTEVALENCCKLKVVTTSPFIIVYSLSILSHRLRLATKEFRGWALRF